MSRPVCGICMCLEDETGCGCGQNNDQISTTLHDNNSNVSVQVDKNPTFKGGSEIPVAWTTSGQIDWLANKNNNTAVVWNNNNPTKMGVKEDSKIIPLYTSPQYRELSDDEIIELTKDSTIFEYREFDDDIIRFAKAILLKASTK